MLRLRLPTGRRHDVTITSSGDQRTQVPLAGHVAGLEAGTTHEVELVPTLPLAGPIQSQGEWRWYRLAARLGSARFALIQQGRERFFAYLPPGRYDLVSLDAYGVGQVHATDIEEGREGIDWGALRRVRRVAVAGPPRTRQDRGAQGRLGRRLR